jgi:hypothetical protein
MHCYEIGKFRGHTLWMWDSDIPDDDTDEDMYVNRHDYSVWYKGRQVGYMKSDKSCVEPFNDRLYRDLKNLKPFTPPKKKTEKVKEFFKETVATPAAEPIPTSVPSLLDAGSEVETMLKSVKDYCGVAVLGDEVFADLSKELEVLMG